MSNHAKFVQITATTMVEPRIDDGVHYSNSILFLYALDEDGGVWRQDFQRAVWERLEDHREGLPEGLPE